MFFLTIGESPRDDLVPELVEIIGKKITVHEIGLIDGISDSEIYRPLSPEDTLVSRRRNGAQVELSHFWLEKRLRELVVEEPAVLLCTSEFYIDKFIKPWAVAKHFFQDLAPLKSLAVFIPDEKQSGLASRWKEFAVKVSVFPYSPYGGFESLPEIQEEFDCV